MNLCYFLLEGYKMILRVCLFYYSKYFLLNCIYMCLILIKKILNVLICLVKLMFSNIGNFI